MQLGEICVQVGEEAMDGGTNVSVGAAEGLDAGSNISAISGWSGPERVIGLQVRTGGLDSAQPAHTRAKHPEVRAERTAW